jgi:hypothetical protein
MKQCSKCKEIKEISEFSRNKALKDGLCCRCKICNRQIVAEWRARHPNYLEHQKKVRNARLDHYQAVRRKWEKKNRKKRVQQHAAWKKANPKRWRTLQIRYKKNNPEKVIARHRLNRVIREQGMPKPDICSSCNEKFDNDDLHGHHEDHSRPLEVQWLCRWCHAKLHRERKEKML